jgi:hypothetical protein
MIQNWFHNVYHNAAQACAKMPHVQMVLSLGKKGVTNMPVGLLETLSNGALIYDYSPQVFNCSRKQPSWCVLEV